MINEFLDNLYLFLIISNHENIQQIRLGTMKLYLKIKGTLYEFKGNEER